MKEIPAAAPPPAAISLPPPKVCGVCRMELTGTSVHFSKDQCIREMGHRIDFLRLIIKGQTDQARQISSAIIASQRFSYAILAHFTTGFKAKRQKKELRAVIAREAFEKLPGGCAVTMVETENGDFEVVGVVPAQKEEDIPS